MAKGHAGPEPAPDSEVRTSRTSKPTSTSIVTSSARDEVEVELFAAERLAFFTDAVVAIAITLLALDLRVPEASSWNELGQAISDNADVYLAFFISFFIIASAWFSHHLLFRYIQRSDSRLLWMNVTWLLLIVIAPFTTRMVVDEKVVLSFRFTCYAAVQVLLALLMIVMVAYARRADLLVTDVPPRVTQRLTNRSLVALIPFALSIPAVFIPAISDNAYIFWWLGPPVIAAFFAVRGRRRRRLASAHARASGHTGRRTEPSTSSAPPRSH